MLAATAVSVSGEPAPPPKESVGSVQGEYSPIDSRRPTITGALPQGWEEDSAWADVTVKYGPTTSNPFSGTQSLRVDVDEIHSGQVQFRIPHLSINPEQLLRITVPLRSENNRPVQLALRKRGAPYTIYWQTTFHAHPEWSLFEALASTPVADADAVLMFGLQSPGSIEVGDAKLEHLSIAEALAGQSFAGNLLPSSLFPLGLTAPWAIGANGTTPEHIQPDPANPGPSGQPGLRLVPHRYEGRPMMQITAPFRGQPGAAHTFSVWAKADRPGMTLHLRMGPPTERLWTAPWQETVALSTNWTRYHLTATLPPAPDFAYLARLTSHDEGVFWIDQVMVEVGEEPGRFRPAGPVEIHAVPTRDWGLSLDDEPLAYRLALIGDTSRVARVVGTVLDLYGEEKRLPDLEWPIAESPSEVALPAPDGYGSFLITLAAVNDEGRPVSRPTELLLHRVRTPRHWAQPAPHSAFGAHVMATESSVRLLKALGFNWNRLHYAFNWTALQRSDGSWNFDWAREKLDLHARHDVTVLSHFGGVPTAYSTVSEDWEGASAWWRTTAAPRMDAMDEWEDYARRVLEALGDRIAAMETWNEPFLPGFFVGDVRQGRPIRERPEVLVEINRRVRNAARDTAYTGPLLWNAGPHYGESERAFDEAALQLGAADYIDGLSFHRYSNVPMGFPGDLFARDLAVVREVFDGSHALNMLWNSEGGHGRSELFNLYRRVPPHGLRAQAAGQAAQFVRYYLSNFAAGVDKVFIYTLYPMDRWVSDYGYLNVDGTLSQIGPAASAMTWVLEDKRFSEMQPLSDTVVAHLYAGDDEQAVVLLPTGRGSAVLTSLPTDLTALDVYGNPPSDWPHDFSGSLLYLYGEQIGLEDLKLD